MTRLLIVILLAAGSSLASPGYGQYKPETKSVAGPGDTKKKTDAETTEKIANLDQLIAEALKNNPDLRVAEAKVRIAEAELYRTRIRIATDLQALHAEIEAAEASAREAYARFKTAEKLFKAGNLSREDYSTSLLTYTKLKADEAAARAKLPYLLGKQAVASPTSKLIDEHIRKTWEQNVKDTAITDDEFIRRAMLDILGRTPRLDEIAYYKSLPAESRRRQLLNELLQPLKLTYVTEPRMASVDYAFPVSKPDNPMMAKLRKALDTPIKLTGDNLNPTEVMNYIRENLNSVNLHVRYKAAKDRAITVSFKEPIPVGAFMQFLEDELQCYFILRDYGVVVVSADEKLPPGALRVTDFWKQNKSADAKEKSTSQETLPPADVRGSVVKVDPKDSSLVQLSIGADAGLKIGHTLNVFRLNPSGYMGELRIVSVDADKSVGQIVMLKGGVSGPPRVQAGDQVAGQLTPSLKKN